MTVKPVETALGTNQQVLLPTYDSEALDGARYLQEVLLGTNADLVVGVDSLPHGGRNFAVNGAFDRWDWGTAADSLALGTITHGPNGWSVNNAAVAQGVGENGTLCATVTPHASPYGYLTQTLTEVGELSGRAVTARCRMGGGIAQLIVGDSSGAFAQSILTDCTDGGWRTMVATLPVASGATSVTVQIAVQQGHPAASIDSVSLAAYAGPIIFTPANPTKEADGSLRRKQTQTFKIRWKTVVTNEQVQFWVPWHGAPLPALPLNDGTPVNDVILTWSSAGAPFDNNILAPGPVIIDFDTLGCNIAVTGNAANTDTYLFNGTISVGMRLT